MSEFVTNDPQQAQRFLQTLDVRAVVMELSAIGRELDGLSHDVAVQDEKVVRAYSAHRRAYAEAFTTGAGSVKDREQAAVLKVEDVKLAAELEEQVLRAMKERVRILRDRLEIGRSINAAVRSQFAAEPVGQS